MRGIKAEEKRIKNFGPSYKTHVNLNKRLNRLTSYQKFKNEVENDYKFDSFIQSDLDLEASFRSISTSSTTTTTRTPSTINKRTSPNRLPPLTQSPSNKSNFEHDKRFSIVISPQKNEYNVFQMFPNVKLSEKNSYQTVKSYLNYKSER